MSDPRLDRVFRAFDAEHAASALQWAEALLEDVPDLWPVWLVYGWALTELTRYEAAQVAIRRGIRLAPREKIALAFCQMGHHYYDRGNLSSAIEWYRKATEVDPARGAPWIYLGDAIRTSGRPAEALVCHRRAVRLARPPDEAHLNVALDLRALGRYRQALVHVRKALAIDPEYKSAKILEEDLIQALDTPGRPRR
ncbi:MAG: tetratricopeptide repeat protein [Planctomycetes bacterium]|nr:tetratricopeptide repeat protein [Planctomycetota bacterium]